MKQKLVIKIKCLENILENKFLDKLKIYNYITIFHLNYILFI